MPDIQELLQGYPVVIQQALAWGEMDAYQHINNIVYFRYFENARLEYVTRLGWPDWSRELGIGPIVSAVQARFRRPLTFPDTISIGARLGTILEDRFTLEHIVVSHNQRAVTTEGEGTIVIFNYADQRKVPIPEFVRRRIEELEATARPIRE
jgi:acyl-CoA thioester hydrolase